MLTKDVVDKMAEKHRNAGSPLGKEFSALVEQFKILNGWDFKDPSRVAVSGTFLTDSEIALYKSCDVADMPILEAARDALASASVGFELADSSDCISAAALLGIKEKLIHTLKRLDHITNPSDLENSNGSGS